MSMGLLKRLAYPCFGVLLGILLVPNAIAQNVGPGDAGSTAGAPAPGGIVFEIRGDLDATGGRFDWHDIFDADGLPIGDPTGKFHFRDGTKNDADGDLTVFAKSDKVFHDPTTYDYKSGSVPPKDDMQNANFFLFKGEDGDQWAAMSGDRLAINGNSYIDFEFLQNTLMEDGSGGFLSDGPHGGRTVGDILATIELTRGGSEPLFFLQEWRGDPVGSGDYNYFDITPLPDSTAYVAANIDGTVPVVYGAFGAFLYETNSFGEAAINVTELILGSNVCDTIKTLFIRTKSSSSETAQLKDLILPIQLNLCLDEELPTIEAPADFEILCENFDGDLDGVDYGTPIVDDNCEVTHSKVATWIPGCDSTGVIEVVWTAVDGCGNIAEDTQFIDVIDLTAPVIACAADIQVECDDTTWTWGPVSATDNCTDVQDINIQLVNIATPTGDGCTTILQQTWRATDLCGNWSECTQTVTVVDTTPPVITCPADLEIDCLDSDQPGNTGTATAIDACNNVASITFNDVRTGDSCETLITRTWTAVDDCGNESTCDQLITIVDDTPPVITCPADLEIDCLDSDQPGNTGTATATDDCNTVTSITFNDVRTGDGCETLITRTWTAVDDCGNESTCDQLITIVDDTPPVITCPADLEIDCLDSDQPGNTGTATATDDCGNVASITFNDVRTGDGCETLITRTWTALDDCGNESTCDQLITIVDDTPPVITCPADLEIDCLDSDQPGNTGTATATDDCNTVASITFNDVRTGDSCETLITRTWTAVDDCGNESTCDQLITIVDDTPPVITCPADLEIDCLDSDQPANTGTATATDDCNTVVSITFNDVRTGDSCETLITRTWTAVDDCGNESTCDQLITIVDDTPPVITCPADLEIDCLDSDQPGNTGTATATDDCNNVASITFNDVRTGDSCETLITRTWTAVDDCGNESTCDQLITIVDDTPPVINGVPTDAALDCGTEYEFCFTATDDCNVATISLEAFGAAGSYEFADLGNGCFTLTMLETTEVTIIATATDGCGNDSAPASVTYTSDCGDFCDGGKPVTLTMRYTQGGCAATAHTQDSGSVTCTEDNGGVKDDGTHDTVYIVVGTRTDTNHKQYRELFAGTVNVGDLYLVNGTLTRRGDLVGNTVITTYASEGGAMLEQVSFHTSCSQPLRSGDQYGSQRLITGFFQ